MATRFFSPPEMPRFTKKALLPPRIVSAHFSSRASRITCTRQQRRAMVRALTCPRRDARAGSICSGITCQERYDAKARPSGTYLLDSLHDGMLGVAPAHACGRLPDQVLPDRQERQQVLELVHEACTIGTGSTGAKG